MKKIQIQTSVINRRFKRNRNIVLEAINSFEGKEVLISFDKVGKKRSSNQNAYYWGVLIPILQKCFRESWGEIWSKEKTHDFCKMQFNFIEKINESTGEIVRIPKSTTENTTTAQEELHLEIRKFILEWFDIEVPLPNENLILEL
jgi:hypothetical protein